MDKPLALEMEHLSIETLLGKMEWGSFTRDFEGKVNY
jgi:hypothetical protein